jgi:hypothetical protein
MEFLALFVSLPTRQAAGRMRIWRALRGLGCATLRDGVFLLPDAPEHAAALANIAGEVLAVQGTADIYRLGGRDRPQEAEIVRLFDRGPDYARLLATMAGIDAGDSKALRGLRRDLAALATIDYFPGEAQRQARAAFAALEAASGGEPATVAGKIRRLASADFQDRTLGDTKRPVGRSHGIRLADSSLHRQEGDISLAGQSEEVSEVGSWFRF